MGFKNSVTNFFLKGHERSLNTKKNIFFSFLLKGGSIITTLLLVPLTLSFVNPDRYGIWLTLSSLISWFNFFDIGLGNGLKTILTEVITKEDYNLARIYISTTYMLLIIIGVILFILFLFFSYFANWSNILNAPAGLAGELKLVSVVVFFAFVIQFVLQLINVVSLSNQNSIIPSLIGFVSNLIALVTIFIYTKTLQHGSLFQLCLAMSVSSVFVFLIFSIKLYKSKYKAFTPSLTKIDFSYTKDITNLGLKFFVIQLGLILYYNSHNIIIAQLFGPQYVTPYNVAYKYFAVITMVSGIIMTPLWSAFAEANVRKDFIWIKNAVKRLEKLCACLFLASIVMLILSPIIYKTWVGKEVHIPFSLSVALCFYTIVNTYRTIFVFYLNGTGKIMLQLYLVLIAGCLNIPLGIFLGKQYGIAGVISATTILCILSGIIEIIQYKKLIGNKALGLWNK